ncbi:hypothetical protein PCE1_001391 [Barthelona sp. PCE]
MASAPQYVSIISGEGDEFLVSIDVALISPYFRKQIAADISRNLNKFNMTFNTNVLEIVIKYMHYKLIWLGSPANRPEFEIPMESLHDVLHVAGYLEI